MTVKNSWGLMNKATTPTPIASLQSVCRESKVWVDAVACCYNFLVANKRATASAIINHLMDQFPLKNAIFVFDGELRQAKQATKAKRLFVQYRKKSKKVGHIINIVD